MSIYNILIGVPGAGGPTIPVCFAILGGGGAGKGTHPYCGGAGGNIGTGSFNASIGVSYVITIGAGSAGYNAGGTTSISTVASVSCALNSGTPYILTYCSCGSPNTVWGGGGGNAAQCHFGGNGTYTCYAFLPVGGSGGAGNSLGFLGGTYGGGGGGGAYGCSGSYGGNGGSGGGGNGGGNTCAYSGGAATGGGGGGSAFSYGNGGGGKASIRYPNTYPNATSTTGSPSFSNTGGYKIYTWTGTGSITF